MRETGDDRMLWSNVTTKEKLEDTELYLEVHNLSRVIVEH